MVAGRDDEDVASFDAGSAIKNKCTDSQVSHQKDEKFASA
jgi:hypothetical protein